MDGDGDSNHTAKKRIASARKKLQQYKAQRALENNNNPSLSSAESNENIDGHSEPEPDHNMQEIEQDPNFNSKPSSSLLPQQFNEGLSPPPTSGFQHSIKNQNFNYGISHLSTSTPLHPLPQSSSANYFTPAPIPLENNETFSLTHPPPPSPNTTSTNQFENKDQLLQSSTISAFESPIQNQQHQHHIMRLSDYDASSSFLRDKQQANDDENDEEIFKPVMEANDGDEHSNNNRTSLDLFGHLNKLYGDRSTINNNKGSTTTTMKAEESRNSNNEEIVKIRQKSESTLKIDNKPLENSAISSIFCPTASSSTTLNTIKRLNHYDEQLYNPQIQEAIELQLSELRKENLRLQSRESELIGQLESSEKCINDLRRERNNANEIARREIGPLQHKLSVQLEENNRLEEKLSLKEKLFEEMEQAFIVVSTSKMELSAQLDLEREKYNAEKAMIPESEKQLVELRKYFEELQVQHERTKLEFGTKLAEMESKKRYFEGLVTKHLHNKDCQNITENGEENHDHQHEAHSGHTHEHHHHNHDHYHENEHDHQDHDHSHDDKEGPTEMEKTLKRLEWENQNYLSELEKLVGVDQERKELKIKLDEISKKNEEYLQENQRLDHLIIQLQGENDTIGDYITLYQTQRMALTERAKEKDLLVMRLGVERENLLTKLEQLNTLVKELVAKNNSEGLSPETSLILNQVDEGKFCSAELNKDMKTSKKIIELIDHINQSPLVENYSPCSVCSDHRLMTV